MQIKRVLLGTWASSCLAFWKIADSKFYLFIFNKDIGNLQVYGKFKGESCLGGCLSFYQSWAWLFISVFFYGCMSSCMSSCMYVGNFNPIPDLDALLKMRKSIFGLVGGKKSLFSSELIMISCISMRNLISSFSCSFSWSSLACVI